MKHAVIIFTFTLLVTLFYNYVGHLVPQKEVPAPETFEVGESLSPEEMISVGKKIVDQKCMSCHSIQPRFPSLNGVGGRAATRIAGYSDVDYLAESLYEPEKFIVAGFTAGMTPAPKPPLSLTDREILTVIAYLQSLGGTPSVTMSTKLKYQSEEGSKPKEAAPPTGGGPNPADQMSGKDLFDKYGCATCHLTGAPGQTVGPSLYDIGKRLTPAQIYESVVVPDAVIAEGFTAGMMGTVLEGSGFYSQANPKQLKTLVEYLTSLKGEGAG